MPASFNNQEPVKVSPLIKGSRWVLLIMGMFYGASKNKFLAQREVGIREKEEKEKEIRLAKIKEEKRRLSEIEIEMLTEMFLGPQKSSETD